ncbi:restriction endonuclease [Paenibacillus oralis]|nr:restriction endonuclease [Paenibacillus oralis]
MWRVQRKARRLLKNIVNLIVLISALTVAITLFKRYSSGPIGVTFLDKVVPDLSQLTTSVEPIFDWIKTWGVFFISVIILTLVLMKVIPYYRKIRMVRRSNIHSIDVMSGDQFEELLVIFFRMQGYSAKKTKRTRDQGADVVLKADGKRIVVQAKREKGKVSNSAVQEVVASKAVYQATEAWVVTNSYFTEPAKELAKANDVLLWDRDRLIKELSKLNMKGQQTDYVT